jgi:hypothetical protein
MSTSRSLVTALICSLVAVPMTANAQAPEPTKEPIKEQAEDFGHDVLHALIGPNWNLFAHGGFTSDDRFLLQRAPGAIERERSLQSSAGYNVGAGVGVDILLRMGFRASYTFRSSDLNFKTDDGNGSDALNMDNVGTLKTHTAALEVIRYMLPSHATINPYGTLGIQGTWWQLDSKSPLITSAGASTPFSISPLFAFGVQFRANDHWSSRLEATLSGGHNPFTGNNSFQALSGPSIDEPTGVNRTDLRFAGVYHFGRAQVPTVASARHK